MIQLLGLPSLLILFAVLAVGYLVLMLFNASRSVNIVAIIPNLYEFVYKCSLPLQIF